MKPAFDHEKNINDLIKMETGAPQQASETIGDKPGYPAAEKPFKFSMKPEELESYLNKYVVGQEGTIEVIATKVCTHFNRMMLEEKLREEQKIVGNIKSNMLLIGPTGVGKTYIVKLIANKIGVPFVKADATKFSETGYVGGDVEDIVRELVQEADGDIKRAEYGIIYLDEIDKIASSGGNYSGPDVSRSGVQRNLLKLMEEAEVDLKTPHDLASQVEAAMEAQRNGKITRKKINTRNILFIVSGAFGGMDQIINKRLNKQSIGFEKRKTGTESNQNILKNVKTEDLLEFGFESEFIGRLPVCVVLNNLDEEGLFQILKNEHSTVVNGKKMDFRAYDIDLKFTDDAFSFLAKKAFAEKTGARGLLNVFEKALIKFEKSLPSTDIKELKVDKNLISNPEDSLRNIIIKEGITKFQKELLTKSGIYLEFEEDAVKAIQGIAGESLKSINQVCNEMFTNYPYGLKLLNLDSFKITKKAVEDPEGYLNEFIKANYSK